MRGGLCAPHSPASYQLEYPVGDELPVACRQRDTFDEDVHVAVSPPRCVGPRALEESQPVAPTAIRLRLGVLLRLRLGGLLLGARLSLLGLLGLLAEARLSLLLRLVLASGTRPLLPLLPSWRRRVLCGLLRGSVAF